MIRQSISITEPNDKWLNSLIESGEYSSKSEIVNDLIRRARPHPHDEHKEWLLAELKKGEESGFAKYQSSAEMLAEFKARYEAYKEK